MLIYVAEDYGDNKLLLKQQIGEFIRKLYRPPRSKDRFVDLSYKIKKVNDERGKYRIEVKVKHLEISDSKFFIIRKPWKYDKAIKYDYLSLFDRIRLYGLNPKEKEVSCRL